MTHHLTSQHVDNVIRSYQNAGRPVDTEAVKNAGGLNMWKVRKYDTATEAVETFKDFIWNAGFIN